MDGLINPTSIFVTLKASTKQYETANFHRSIHSLLMMVKHTWQQTYFGLITRIPGLLYGFSLFQCFSSFQLSLFPSIFTRHS